MRAETPETALRCGDSPRLDPIAIDCRLRSRSSDEPWHLQPPAQRGIGPQTAARGARRRLAPVPEPGRVACGTISVPVTLLEVSWGPSSLRHQTLMNLLSRVAARQLHATVGAMSST